MRQIDNEPQEDTGAPSGPLQTVVSAAKKPSTLVMLAVVAIVLVAAYFLKR